MVADALEAETFEDGTAIITEGEVGCAFYIIVEGQVRVSQNNEEVARLGESAYFGEIALLTNQPRRATVRVTTCVRHVPLVLTSACVDGIQVTAVGTTRCAKVSREKFFRVMGPCQEVLRHNMLQRYPQYVALL